MDFMNSFGGVANLDPTGRGGSQPDGRPNDPKVGGRIDEIDEKDVVTAVMETYRHEYMTRRPFEREWNRAWERIQNRYDWRKKSRWQSQRNFPAVLILALQYVWELTKAMEKAGDNWFEAETSDPDWQPLLNVPRNIVRRFIQDTSAPEDNFLSLYFEAVFYGVITGQVVIRAIAEEDGFTDMTDTEARATISELFATAGLDTAIPSFGFGTLSDNPDEAPPPPGRTGFRVRADVINPRCFIRDTAPGRVRPRYVIHTQSMTRAEFRAEAAARGWKHVEEICAMETQFQGEYEASERKVLEKRLAQSGARVDQIVLHHCYGTFTNSQGRAVVEKPSFFIIANRKYITSDVVDLPYWHGQIPVVQGGTLPLPGNPYSSSLLGVNLDAQEVKVDLNNQILDYMNSAIYPPTEVDVDQINNVGPNQLAAGVFPGLLLKVQKYGGNNGPAVARTGMPDVSSGVWQAFGYLKGELQEYTGMGSSPAMPRSRNRMSASEQKAREAASVGIIEQVCHNLERAVLEPLIYQLYLLILQKCPQEDWELAIQKEIDSLKNRTGTTPPGQAPPVPPIAQPQPPGPDGTAPPPVVPPPPPEYDDPALVEKLELMKKLTPRERFVQLAGRYKFKVKIYTALESRRDKFEKLLQLAEIAQGTPAVMSRMKWHVWTEEVLECLELDPEKYLWPNAGPTAEAMMSPTAVQPAYRPPDLVAPVSDQPIAPPKQQ